MTPIPKKITLRKYFFIFKLPIPDLIVLHVSYAWTRSWTSLCSHETNPFVVQLYEPILLIVLPYRLLVCSKISKPPSLRPWHTHNHHTMDSSPNSSWWEHNSFLPIVRPTHVITILRTTRHLAVDGNYTVPCPSCVPPLSTSQTPIGLSPTSPTRQTHANNFLSLGNTKPFSTTIHKNLAPCHSCLSHVCSPKRVHLSRPSWITSPERVWNSGLTMISRLGEVCLSRRGHLSPKPTIQATHQYLSRFLT